jgi:BMFP domain-containing protein YqiC
MEARARWRALEPRISALEATLTRTGAQVSTAIADELAAVTRAAR